MDQERRSNKWATGDLREALCSHRKMTIFRVGGSFSYESGLEDESLEDAWDGKHVKDGEYNSLLRLCATCFDAPRDCFFLPCAHCAACSGCAARIADVSETYPICRRCIKKVRKLYTV